MDEQPTSLLTTIQEKISETITTITDAVKHVVSSSEPPTGLSTNKEPVVEDQKQEESAPAREISPPFETASAQGEQELTPAETIPSEASVRSFSKTG